MRRNGNLVPIGVSAVIGLVLLGFIGAPVWSYLPYIAIFALCPLAMIFMMRGMNHAGESTSDESGEKARAPGGHRH